MHVKMIFQKGPIELWKTFYGLYDRPSFVVISFEDHKHFPLFYNPENGMQALEYIRELRRDLNI